MRCYSWNVNGIRSVARKGLLPWDVLPRADLIALQETKAQPGQLPPELLAPGRFKSHWHSAQYQLNTSSLRCLLPTNRSDRLTLCLTKAAPAPIPSGARRS